MGIVGSSHQLFIKLKVEPGRYAVTRASTRRTSRSVFSACLLSLALHSLSVSGNDCQQADIELHSQEAVDNFQADYGGGEVCNAVTGSLRIFSYHDDSIVNLNGLSALDRVGDNLDISDNHFLQDVAGLSALTSVGGRLVIGYNDSLVDISGLSALTSVGGDLAIANNGALLNLDGLSALTSIGGSLSLRGPHPFAGRLQNIDGLSSLAAVGGDVIIERNYYLRSIDGLKNLTRINGKLSLYQNSVLETVDGLQALTEVGSDFTLALSYSLANLDGLSSLTSVGDRLTITNNQSLSDLDGLSSLRDVGVLAIDTNSALADCLGVVRLVDMFDDYEAGPADPPMPDVESEAFIFQNAKGCNSVDEILGSAPIDGLNPGLNDAWFNPVTDGQGFLINVFPAIGQVFLAWFTYDTERPQDNVTAILGDPGHRWLTAQGEYSGSEALLELWLTSGGIFDAEEPVPDWRQDGDLLLEFDTCNSGTIQYDVASIDRQGSIPIERITLDNVALCYELNASYKNPG